MHMSSSRRLWLISALAAPLGACSSPIDPTNLADQAALHAREVVHQSGGGVAFALQDNSGVHNIGTGINHATSAVMGAMPSMMPPGMMSAMGTSPMSGMSSLMTTEEQFDTTADDLKVWLRERVLADSNLESKTDDEAIYLLNPDPTCRALPQDGDPPGTLPPIGKKCADQLTKLQVRVSLRADGDGVRLTILLGPQPLELSSIIIHSDLIAVEEDLPKAYAASQYVDQTLGTDSPTGTTQFENLTGVLRVSLQKNGDKKVTFTYSVLSAIHVATHQTDGTLGPDVTMAASDPTFQITGDGNAQSLTVKVDMGALDVLGDWDPQGTLPANRDLHVGIGELTGQATYTEGQQQFVITGLGIGETVIDVHQSRIFDLDLNPNDMHRFDLTLSADQTQQALAQVTPRFDLSLGFDYAAIASDYTTPPASYLLDETYRFDLENGGGTSGVTGANASGTFPGGLKVTAGTLTISSNKATDAVVVPAGKCLTGNNTPAPGAHPLLGKLAVVDCP
jgi:hypothetical protein